ncbi:MAG: NAD(P)-dependent oxidoreductase [Hyphomicrobiaceae bacterium]
MTLHDDPKQPSWRVLCLGLGYTAAALARRLAPQGTHIAGTARSAEGTERIAKNGWQDFVFDGPDVSPGLAREMSEATHILVSAAPDEAGDPVLRHLGSCLEGATKLRWIGYLSTVSVYGDHGGAWVDETTAPRDPGRRGLMRIEAENEWLAFGKAHTPRVDVFRLPGIYGPGRGAVHQLRSSTARRIAKPGQVFNRVHVDDIAAALEAAMTAPSAHNVYNITDDEPAPADEVVAYAATLLGLEPPPLVRLEDANFSPIARSFYDQTKRVSNKRMKESLGVKLAYPTYREGMAATVASSPTQA